MTPSDFQEVLAQYQRPVWLCIASGPSLTQADVDRFRGIPTIAVNNNYQLAPWADILYACDARWWKHYKPEFDGLKLSWQKTDQSIRVPSNKKEDGLGRDHIRTGGNSGYQAVNLAYLLGARLIVLLGYDMQGGHWHPDHPKPLPNGRQHAERIRRFGVMAKELRREGVRVINATRQTDLNCFERMPISDALDEVRQVLRTAGNGVRSPQAEEVNVG